MHIYCNQIFILFTCFCNVLCMRDNWVEWRHFKLNDVHLADIDVKEAQTLLLPILKNSKKTRKIQKEKSEIPDSIDWRDYGVISPIRDQLFCNSCWAFAVVSTIEAHYGIYNQKNITLSEENLVDCVYPNFECRDKMKITALEDCYQYVLDNGIVSASSYPYDEYPLQCRYNADDVTATIKDYVTVPEGDEEELKAVVGTVGPVAVIITTGRDFLGHSGGVYYTDSCSDSPEPYNHAVTVIGYGVEDGQEYWLVRNEWGELFGDQGYIKMARNRDNMCGIASYASYPIVQNTYQKVATVSILIYLLLGACLKNTML